MRKKHSRPPERRRIRRVPQATAGLPEAEADRYDAPECLCSAPVLEVPVQSDCPGSVSLTAIGTTLALTSAPLEVLRCLHPVILTQERT